MRECLLILYFLINSISRKNTQYIIIPILKILFSNTYEHYITQFVWVSSFITYVCTLIYSSISNILSSSLTVVQSSNCQFSLHLFCVIFFSANLTWLERLFCCRWFHSASYIWRNKHTFCKTILLKELTNKLRRGR